MRVVLQRVNHAQVKVDNQVIGSINQGLVLLVAVAASDENKDIDWIINKVLNLKVFADASGKFKHSVADIKGEILVVSQFTLYGDVRKGTVPSWSKAAPPDQAEQLYNEFVERLRNQTELKIEQGKFQAYMQVELENDGPVTLLIDSPVTNP